MSRTSVDRSTAALLPNAPPAADGAISLSTIDPKPAAAPAKTRSVRVATRALQPSVANTPKPFGVDSKTTGTPIATPRRAAAVPTREGGGKRTFDWEASRWQRGVRLELTGRSGDLALPPVALASKPSTASSQSRVVVDGVSIPRFQPQEAISKRYTEADLAKLNITAANTRIYVLDDFVNPSIYVGTAGSNNVFTTHGDVTAGIVGAALKGKGEVIRVNSANKGETAWSGTRLAKKIDGIVAAEAKRQNKTPATVDLSQVTISMSLDTLSDVGVVATAVAAFTARGGHFFAAAGNVNYANSSVYKNTSTVDGSSTRIGERVPNVQKPWSQYKNGALDDNGNDVRARRPIDPSSQSIIAPSKLETRVNNGAVEYRDNDNPAGWSKLVEASNTSTMPVVTTASDGLAGVKPEKLVTGKQVKEFQEWQFKTYREAAKNSANKNAETSMDLTPEELSRVEQKVAAERKRSIGDRAVMTLDEYIKFTGCAPDSVLRQNLNASVPEGKTSTQIILSADQVLDAKDDQGLQYFVLDGSARLATVQRNTSTTFSYGTSWATPVAAANHAIWQREQVAAAKAAKGR